MPKLRNNNSSQRSEANSGPELELEKQSGGVVALLGIHADEGVAGAFGGGLGYRTPDDALIEAHRRLDRNVQMFPSGDVLGGVSKWPALFVGRGLWDFSESLEGSLACLKRCKGPRMIATVRAPHGEGEWGAGNIGFMQEQMVAFATHALRGEAVPGYVEPYDVRDAVAAAPAAWAPAAHPKPSKASA